MVFLLYVIVVHSLIHDLVIGSEGLFSVHLHLHGAPVRVNILLYACNSLRTTECIVIELSTGEFVNRVEPFQLCLRMDK
jgi:hypothetical protein